MGKILVKRVYEPVAKSDGFRVLVDRLWPRGLTKFDAKLDLWLPDLGPSTALRQWFNHDPARWIEFCRRYQVEVKGKKALLATITAQVKTRPVTLLYSAKDEQHNQAVAIQSLLLKRANSRTRNRRKKRSAKIVTGRKKMTSGPS